MNLRKITVLACCGLIAFGCAATKQATVETRSGFLGSNYDLLKPGTDKQAQLVYTNPNTDFHNYNKVLLAPVVVVRSKNSKLAQYSTEDLQRIANNAYSAFAKELSKQVELVSVPQRGTMRVELAITDADRSEPVMDTISSIVPQARLVSTLKGVITGKPGFVGEASGEAKITDALTGELLSAGMDRRVGTKNLSGSTDSWNDVEEAIEFWSKRFAYNLCVKRGGKNCPEPSA